MTAAANDTWIENSLARLETLEAQREHLAATGQTARLAEIDEEIKGLYEALESVASDDDSDDEPANEAVGAPVGAWPMAAAPVAAVASPQPMMDMGPPPSSDYSAPITFDDGDAKPRSALPLVLVGLLAVGGGGGAFWLMSRDQPEEAKPAPTEPATVIKMRTAPAGRSSRSARAATSPRPSPAAAARARPAIDPASPRPTTVARSRSRRARIRWRASSSRAALVVRRPRPRSRYGASSSLEAAAPGYGAVVSPSVARLSRSMLPLRPGICHDSASMLVSAVGSGTITL
jgi:hypothetical protein